MNCYISAKSRKIFSSCRTSPRSLFLFCFPFSRLVSFSRSSRSDRLGSSRCGLKAAQLPSYQDFFFSGTAPKEIANPRKARSGLYPLIFGPSRTVKCVFEFGNVLAFGSRTLSRTCCFLSSSFISPSSVYPERHEGPRPVSIPISSCFTRPRTLMWPRFYLLVMTLPCHEDNAPPIRSPRDFSFIAGGHEAPRAHGKYWRIRITASVDNQQSTTTHFRGRAFLLCLAVYHRIFLEYVQTPVRCARRRTNR
mgnify:CR=1 FL=1